MPKKRGPPISYPHGQLTAFTQSVTHEGFNCCSNLFLKWVEHFTGKFPTGSISNTYHGGQFPCEVSHGSHRKHMFRCSSPINFENKMISVTSVDNFPGKFPTEGGYGVWAGWEKGEWYGMGGHIPI